MTDTLPPKYTLAGLRKILDFEFVEPSPMTRHAYDRLTDSDRFVYDTLRLDWFGAGFLVNTTEKTNLSRSVRSYLRTRNVHAVGSQRVVVLDGEANVGKTTMLIQLAREIEERERGRLPSFRRHGRVPVVMIEMTPNATPKNIAASVLEFFESPYRRRDNQADLIRQAVRTMMAHETSLLIIDEFQMLTLHGRRGDDAVNAVKSLINNTSVVTVIAGVHIQKDLVSRAAQQLIARGEVQELLPSILATDRDRSRWAGLVSLFGQQMYLIDGDPHLERIAAPLHGLTGGNIGNLRLLLSKAMSTLIDEQSSVRGVEELTKEDIFHAALRDEAS